MQKEKWELFLKYAATTDYEIKLVIMRMNEWTQFILGRKPQTTWQTIECTQEK